MTRNEYFKRAFDACNSGKVSGEVYDAMLLNVDAFCYDDDDEDDMAFPYFEVEENT